MEVTKRKTKEKDEERSHTDGGDKGEKRKIKGKKGHEQMLPQLSLTVVL